MDEEDAAALESLDRLSLVGVRKGKPSVARNSCGLIIGEAELGVDAEAAPLVVLELLLSLAGVREAEGRAGVTGEPAAIHTPTIHTPRAGTQSETLYGIPRGRR